MNNVTINTAVKIQITCMEPTYNRNPWQQTLLLRHDSERHLVLRGHQGAVYDLAWNEAQALGFRQVETACWPHGSMAENGWHWPTTPLRFMH